MKCILLMFDSLNRHMLEPYGCEWVRTPSFRRLSERTVTFENSYVGSMPCMPARRELHTGRYNFLHRSWGPLEPFDDSMPELLKNAGVRTHLITDHYHYFEAGGCTYHTRYSSWEISRGQEGDPWKGHVADTIPPQDLKRERGAQWRQDWVNPGGKKIAAKIPVRFKEIWHFNQGRALNGSTSYEVIFKSDGVDFANTMLPLPAKLDVTGKNLFDLIREVCKTQGVILPT